MSSDYKITITNVTSLLVKSNGWGALVVVRILIIASSTLFENSDLCSILSTSGFE